MKARISIRYYIDCQSKVLELDDHIDFENNQDISYEEAIDGLNEVAEQLKDQVRSFVGKNMAGNVVFGSTWVDTSKVVACKIWVEAPEKEEARKKQAEERRKDIEVQLAGGKCDIFEAARNLIRRMGGEIND